MHTVRSADVRPSDCDGNGSRGRPRRQIFAACAASLVIRFRRSHSDERQQIKLFAFSASMIAAFILLGNVLEALTGSADDRLDDRIAIIVFPIVLSGIPLAVGVAILRYRLYDIDRIISRTLAYGVLTVV